MTTALLGLVAMAALMALFTVAIYWYCRHIRDGRINLYTNPEWTSITGPASPHSLLDPNTSLPKRSEYDDDHVRHQPDE
jgi:hypothetical protein